MAHGDFNSGADVDLHGWLYIVANFIGPSNGEGIRIYVNGDLFGSDVEKSDAIRRTGNGKVMIGAPYIDNPTGYSDGNVTVDELMFFNQKLEPAEILMIYNMFY